jgi:CheY-like chemotaxis protein
LLFCRSQLSLLSSLTSFSNKINQRIILKLMDRLGWKQSSLGSACCSVAGDGLQCLSQLAAALAAPNAHLLVPHVLLMDVAMEGMDGLDCTRQIRKEVDAKYLALQLAPPYIIACTATASLENRRLCLQAGMNAFLTKPLAVETLVAAIKEARCAITRHFEAKHQA